MKLSIKNLTKRYPGGITALDSISLEMSAGMYGLLGPNGAGKSTLMRILSTLLHPDSGIITFNEIDLLSSPHAVREKLGYLPQEFGLYNDLTAERMLHHLAILKGFTHSASRKAHVNQLLEQTNLHQAARQKLGSYSGGMRRRLGIALALLGDPELLIVDEPTAGLDPEERRRFYNILSEASEHRIVILSTHIVEDVSVLCPKMAILNRGQVLFSGKPAEAVSPLADHTWTLDTGLLPDWQNKLSTLTVLQTRRIAGRKILHLFSHENPANSLTSSVDPSVFRWREPDLEDAYFYHLRSQSDDPATQEPAHVV